jgi:hypothetical protein
MDVSAVAGVGETDVDGVAETGTNERAKYYISWR